MDPEIRNFEELERLIKQHPNEAAGISKEWENFTNFIKTSHPDLLPQILSISSSEQFYAWSTSHPELNIDPSVFRGKEIQESYFYLREQHEDKQMEEQGYVDPGNLPGGLENLALAPLALLFSNSSKLLEQDKDYQKIIDKKWAEWLKKNPGKDLNTKEGQDYFFGSLDLPNERNIHDDARDEFSKNGKFKKRLEKYDKEKKKVYKDPSKDPSIQYHNALIDFQTQTRFNLLKKENPDVKMEEVRAKVSNFVWQRFVWKHPEKAKTYKETHKEIKNVYDLVEINRTLSKGEKDIKYVEKTHHEERKENQPSVNDSIRILENINKAREEEAKQAVEKLYVERRGPIRERVSYPETPEPQPPEPPPSPPQPPRPPSGGSGSPKIPGINNLASSLGRQAGSGAKSLLLATSQYWLPVLVILIIIIVIIVVISNGGEPNTKPEGSIAACTFYRGDAVSTSNPDGGLKFRSPELVKLVNDVSYQVGVPPALLAGMLRIESANVFYTNDDSYVKNDFDSHCAKKEDGGCLTSGGYGIYGAMQFYAPTFKSIFERHKDDLKSLFNKTDVDIDATKTQDTMAPDTIFRIYSVKDSLIAAAYKLRDAGATTSTVDYDTIKNIVNDYFTRNPDLKECEYKSGGSIYNYCDDLWKSYSSCKPSTTPYTPGEIPPAPDNFTDLRDGIRSNFHIVFSPDFDDGNHLNYLKWAWDILWSANNTKFMQLVDPNNQLIVVTAIPVSAGFNEEYACDQIGMRLGRINPPHDPYDENFFKVIFVHELSHIIENCNDNSQKTQLSDVINQEGYITNFSHYSNQCASGDIQLNEDYAESFAYFLNRNVPELTLNIGSQCNPTQSGNPYDNNKPLHEQFVANLLGVNTNDLSPTPSTSSLYGVMSCPVVGGGPIVLSSYQASPVYGHCGQKYVAAGQVCSSGTDSRRAKSIDVETCINPRPACQIDTCKPLTNEQKASLQCGQDGKNVVLPSIKGVSDLKWKRLNNIPLSQGDCFDYEILDPNGLGGGCGVGYVFEAFLPNGENWVLHLLHMGLINTSVQIGGYYSPGTLIGKTEAIHTHISVGHNITDPYSQTESGWLAADKDLALCSP